MAQHYRFVIERGSKKIGHIENGAATLAGTKRGTAVGIGMVAVVMRVLRHNGGLMDVIRVLIHAGHQGLGEDHDE